MENPQPPPPSIHPFLNTTVASPSDEAIFQPDYCDTPRDTKPNARPFTASASSDTLYTCVHYARNLQTLVAAPPTSFVVCRVGRVLEPSNASEFWSCPHGEKHVYSMAYTQFASSRIVDSSFDPTFNELLVVNIPPHASADGAGGGWGVRLDLIQRPSANNQGDDILLAFAALPLDGFRPGAELSMTLAFPRQSQTTTTEQAEIFVTMFRQRRDAAMSTLWHRLELTIDAMPATHGSLKHEQTIAVVQIVPSATTSVPLLVESPLVDIPFLFMA